MTGRSLATWTLTAGLGLILAAADEPPAPAASRPAPRMTADWAVAEARSAPDRWFLSGADLEDLDAEPRFDPERGQWRVAFLHGGEAVFDVTVDDATGAVVTQHFLGQDPAVRTPGEAVDRVRRDETIGRYTRNRSRFTLVPRFDAPRRLWRVRVLDRGQTIGTAWINRRTIAGDGPWNELSGSWLKHAWREVRPALGRRQVQYLCAILFMLITLNVRRALSMRGLEVVALVLLVPAGLLVPRMPLLGYGALWTVTLYLFFQALVRSRRGRGTAAGTEARQSWGPAERLSTRGLVLAVIVVLAVQAVAASRTDTGGADTGGLVGGEAFFDTGLMPYSTITRDFRTYGPAHFLLYGLAAQACPTGVDWRTYDLDNPDRPVDGAGGRVLVFLFHVLTVAALVGVGRKFTGDVRLGLLLALAYMLLPQTVDKIAHGSRLMPGTYFILALWAWPNPWLSALCLGVGAAQWWFPAAVLPFWLMSFRRWNKLKFAAVLLILAVVFGALMMRPAPEQSVGERWRDVRDATIFCQERFAGHLKYNPTDGFWRQLTKREVLKPGVIHRPVAGQVRVGVLAGFGVFCLVLMVLPWRKGPRQMAALTAAVVVGTQLWKNLHSAEYIGWYAPVLLTALFVSLPNAWPRERSPSPVACDGDTHAEIGADE